MIDEISLMLKVKEGQMGYLSELFEANHRTLFNFYLRMGLNRMLAEDMVQETFMRILAYRTTYELLREGKMPESETMFGKLLNGLLIDEDDNELRSQQIDGAKLPPFQEVAKYLGPAGAFMQTVENGWFSSGCLVRQVKVVAQADASSVSEETNRSEQSLR